MGKTFGLALFFSNIFGGKHDDRVAVILAIRKYLVFKFVFLGSNGKIASTTVDIETFQSHIDKINGI